MSDMLLHHGTDLLGAIGILRDDRIDASQHYAHQVPGVSFAREWRMAHDFGTYWERLNPVVLTTSRTLLRKRRGSVVQPYRDTSQHGETRKRESEELLVGPLERVSEVLLSIDLDPLDLEAAMESREDWEWLLRESHDPPAHLRTWSAWCMAVERLSRHPLVNAARPRHAPRIRTTERHRKAT
jgi:hypothetical protein